MRTLRSFTYPARMWNPAAERRDSICYVDVSAVSRDTLTIGAVTPIRPEDAPSRARKIVQANDTIFATVRPRLKRVAKVPPELHNEIVSTAFCVLRPDKEQVDPDYLFFLASGDGFVASVAERESGASYPAVRDGDVLDREVDLPALGEQRKVAGALRTVREAVLSEVGLLGAAEELKRAAMRELFTRGLRGEPQKDTEIGPIPGSWTPVPCQKVFKLASGKTRPDDLEPKPVEGKAYPVLGGNGVMGYSAFWNVDVPDTVVIGRVGEYCGAVHMTSGRAWITDNAMYSCEWLLPQARPGFVGRYLEHYDLNRFKRMSGQPLVTQGIINEHSIPLPGGEEQREIVAILDAIDRKIALHKQKRAVLEELFQALLHKLMTGEIRVSDLDLSALSTGASA